MESLPAIAGSLPAIAEPLPAPDPPEAAPHGSEPVAPIPPILGLPMEMLVEIMRNLATGEDLQNFILVHPAINAIWTASPRIQQRLIMRTILLRHVPYRLLPLAHAVLRAKNVL